MAVSQILLPAVSDWVILLSIHEKAGSSICLSNCSVRALPCDKCFRRTSHFVFQCYKMGCKDWDLINWYILPLYQRHLAFSWIVRCGHGEFIGVTDLILASKGWANSLRLLPRANGHIVLIKRWWLIITIKLVLMHSTLVHRWSFYGQPPWFHSWVLRICEHAEISLPGLCYVDSIKSRWPECGQSHHRSCGQERRADLREFETWDLHPLLLTLEMEEVIAREDRQQLEDARSN